MYPCVNGFKRATNETIPFVDEGARIDEVQKETRPPASPHRAGGCHITHASIRDVAEATVASFSAEGSGETCVCSGVCAALVGTGHAVSCTMRSDLTARGELHFLHWDSSHMQSMSRAQW